MVGVGAPVVGSLLMGGDLMPKEAEVALWRAWKVVVEGTLRMRVKGGDLVLSIVMRRR